MQLPSGRVFFSAPVWQAVEVDSGRAELKKARAAYDEANDAYDAAVAEEGEDVNPLRNPFRFRKRVLLVDARTLAARRLEKIARLASPDDGRVAGPWPGVATDNSLTLGKGGLVVKRESRLGVGVEYHILGTFDASPVEPALQRPEDADSESDSRADRAQLPDPAAGSESESPRAAPPA